MAGLIFHYDVYLDGHVTLRNGNHDLTSNYNSKAIMSGLILSGTKSIDAATEIWPTLSVNASVTDLGTIGFTGKAYGITDSSLSMGGGRVSYADCFPKDFGAAFLSCVLVKVLSSISLS